MGNHIGFYSAYLVSMQVCLRKVQAKTRDWCPLCSLAAQWNRDAMERGTPSLTTAYTGAGKTDEARLKPYGIKFLSEDLTRLL